jgi:acyl-CoA synthetase (AMP-forming)/AMP-acid ligase II
MNIIDILESNAKNFPDKPAVYFKDKEITFGQIYELTAKLAVVLSKLGLKKNDKVAFYLPQIPEYYFCYLAVWALGLTCVPLDFMLTEDELVSCLTHSEARLLITYPKASLSLTSLKNRCSTLGTIAVFDNQLKPGKIQIKQEAFLNLTASMKDVSAGILQPESKEDDYAIIFYTSGTTGKPKGVLINYKQLEAPPKSMEFFVDLNKNDITLCSLPFSHLGGLIYILNGVHYGISVVLMERFVPVEFLKNIQTYRVSCFWIVPSMYYAFLQFKEFESFDLSSLRWIVTFGASNFPEALRRFHAFCPRAELLNGWGLTETNAPTTVLPMGSDKIESVGRPAPWIEVKIFDDNSNQVECGKVGEVVVKSWVVTDGYFKDPELTGQVIKKGWFYTGDLGRFDDAGFLYIVGRKKEMIKVGGEIVFEPEIESVIFKHPAVSEVAVVGVCDKLRGEVPKAFIVLKEGQQTGEEDLRFFCRQHLAHFKIPHFFEFRDTLPKNRTGKIAKEALRNA